MTKKTVNFYSDLQTDVLLTAKADKSNVYTKAQVDEAIDTKASKTSVYNKQEMGAFLDAKADKVLVYTKTETDTLLNAKADAADVYTKTETDTLLNAKADAADVYTKTETDTLLTAKADAADVYTKTETDTAIGGVTGRWVELDPANLPSDFADGDVLMFKPVAGESSGAISTTTSTGIVIADMFGTSTNWCGMPYKYGISNPVKVYTLDGIYAATNWNNGQSTDALIKIVIANFTSNGGSTRLVAQDITRADFATYVGRLWRLKR